MIEGFRRVNIMPQNGTEFHINDVLYSSKFKRNLISFKDIHKNGHYIESMNEDNVEYIYFYYF